MVTPAVVPVPHVGGPIMPPCYPPVLIGNMPAARISDLCLCVGPPDVIVQGSPTVIIGMMPAARLGDMTAHGGVIVTGWPTVLIGDSGGGPATPSMPGMPAVPGVPAIPGAADAEVAANESAKSPPSAASSSSTPGGGPARRNYVSEAEAQQLFNELRSHTEIPFDYPPDCCYARASAMGDILATHGVEARKVWTYGNLVPMAGPNRPVTFPPGSQNPADQVTWRYHVAPTIRVQRADGTVQDMVMDPSLSTHPLTIAEWNAIMSGPGSQITQTAQTGRDVFYRAPDGTPMYETPQSNRNTAMADHIRTRNARLGRK
jgi:uncharacterized Zn-binding protein involved in type VI secretion